MLVSLKVNEQTIQTWQELATWAGNKSKTSFSGSLYELANQEFQPLGKKYR